MVVLITGVAGLIGSRLGDWIIKNVDDCKVIGIDNLSGGFKENVNSNIDFFNIDLVDGDIQTVFKAVNPDIVYHLAAYAAEGLSPFIRSYNYKNNLVATSRVINECIRYNVKRLVFTSSMAVYGRSNNPIFSENLTPNPIDPYGIAKYACEMDISVAGDQHKLDWCILRPHNVYGIKQNIWDSYRNVLGIWMWQSLNNLPMTVYGTGNQTRSFSCIDDILGPMWNAGILDEASKQIINIGGVKPYKVVEACKLLQRITNNSNIEFLEERHEVSCAVPSYEKSVDILKFNHKVDLYDGAEEMWKWVLQQPKRKRCLWENYEIDQGIYKYWIRT